MIDELIFITDKLYTWNQKFIEIFWEGREKGEKEDFYEVIKPFVDEVREWNLKWKNLMIDWLRENPQKHIHLAQITSMAENIEQLSIQAFFPETSKTRFLNTNRTVEYFLLELLKLLQKERDAQIEHLK